MSTAPSIDHYLSDFRNGDGSPRGDPGIVTVVREYLAAVRAFLRDLHRSSASGREVNEAHSDCMDRLLRRLFSFAEEEYFESREEAAMELTVMAVGGYARREMSIHSDVDLLFLYRKELTPYVAGVARHLQTWLWDAALTVGGSTRTIPETVGLARQDSTVRTALLEPRFLVGSGVLFHEFADRLRTEVFSDPDAFIAEQIEAMQERHRGFGDSLYLLQPNLKEGAGGLRDFHVAYWAMQATQPSARGCDAFLHLGLLTEAEVRDYHAALDFMWRVRNELHLISGRKYDQMSFELQEQIADSFGYGQTRDAGAELPVERFMRDYYRHARAISNYSSLVIEQCRARSHRAPRKRRVREVEDGFRIANGQLEIPHARQLRERPIRLLTAFAVAQEHDVAMTRKARRLIRENLRLIDDDFRRSREARDLFLRILGSDRRVMRSLKMMNEVGLLGVFLPEWEHIVCRWQHVMYHTYTVDVHSIFLVEELRRLWRKKYQQALPDLTDLMLQCEDRPALFLGCLLHDIGKGFGGDHSIRGAERARACLERLGLAPERIERALFLVRNHLLMSHLAQRRDLSDPRLIVEFARAVGDRTNLHHLYLLTFADNRASSSTGWTEWKRQLLRDLFERTSEFLETGADDPGRAVELIERRMTERRERATGELRALGVAEAHIQAYFEMMPHRYLSAHSPQEMARHALVVMGLGRDRIMSTAFRDMLDGFSELILWTADVHGLYANVAGILTAHGINILGAHVYTARSGLALEVYRLATPPGGEDERRIRWQEVEASLAAMLRGELCVEDLLRRRGRPVGTAGIPSSVPPSVAISNEISDFYTVVDVSANDRLGLLHDLTRTIAELGHEIYISKSATIRDQVADTFYIKDRNGRKLQDPGEIEQLRGLLLEAARLDEAAGGG